MTGQRDPQPLDSPLRYPDVFALLGEVFASVDRGPFPLAARSRAGEDGGG